MELKSDYEQSEVGVIPKDWEVKLLMDVADVKGGKRLPKGRYLTDVVNQHPYIRVADMYMGGVSMKDIQYVPVEVFPFIKNYRIYDSDLFISVAGTLGVVGKVPSRLDGANLTENADKITNISCDREYLFYSLLSQRMQGIIESQKTIGAQPKLALNRIQQFAIPFPPTQDEQRAIAAALSDVDMFIVALDTLIAKKRDLKTAAMQQLLTGKQRVATFNREWTLVKMAEHFTLKARIGWQGLTTAEYLQTGNYYLVTGTDFHNGRVNWSTCHYVDAFRYDQDRNIQLKQGDVLLTKDGTIGKAGYVDALHGPATLNSGVFVIRPKSNIHHSLYLYYILISEIFDDFLNKLQAGSTISHLYQKDFVSFSFSAPQIEEQIAIAKVLSDMDAELAALEAKRDKTRDLKRGMMQELLTGRTRLMPTNSNSLT